MDLDFMTAPVVDEFGNAEYDNTFGEYIMNSLEEYDEEDTQFFDVHDDASHDAEGYEESGDPTYYNDDARLQAWHTWHTSHTRTPPNLHTCTSAHLDTCTPAHLRTCANAHLHKCAPAHLRTCTPAHLHTRTPAYLHT